MTTITIRKTIRVLLLFISFFCATSALAANLVDVYKQALASDPTFQAAQATYLSETQAYPQARALLFPQLKFSTLFQYNHTDARLPEVKSEFRSLDYKITYAQPIFDVGQWSQLHIAKSQVKAAAANFAAAQQDLILRTATAYFNVLEAEDNLRFTQAEKKGNGRTVG